LCYIYNDFFSELLEASEYEIGEKSIQEAEKVLPAAAVTLSPLLPGVLETAAAMNDDQFESIKYFISCVVIHLLHSQTSSGTLLNLVQRWSGLLPSSVMMYICGWSPERSPQSLKKPFGSQSPESKISKALLQPVEYSISHILGLDVDPSVVNNESKASNPMMESVEYFSSDSSCFRDPIHVLLLYKLSLFHMTQLASRGELTKSLKDKCREVLLLLLHIVCHRGKKHQDEVAEASLKENAHLLNKEHLSLHCLKHTFTHPFLLYSFTPIYRKKQITEKLVTELVLDLLKFLSLTRTDTVALSSILKPFKQKLIQHIIGKLKKNKLSCLNMESVVPFVELFELNLSEVMNVMDLLVKVPTEALISINNGSPSISVWGSLLMHLLGCCIDLHKPVSAVMVTAIANHVAQLAKQEQLHSSQMEECFLQYLEKFPHHLEHIQTRKRAYSSIFML
jgi:hypothetical protein